MKYILKLILFFCFAGLLACNDTDTSAVSYTNHDSLAGKLTYSQPDTTIALIIDETIKQLLSEQKTGDVDFDYTNTIININKAAIEITKLYLLKSKNNELKKLATEDLQVHREKISNLSHFQKLNSGNVSPRSTEFQQVSKTAIAELGNKKEAENNFDEDFAFEMLQLERVSAVVAEGHLDYGSIQPLKIISRSIISHAKQNSSRLKKWVTEPK
jgi:uncharacterized protein (DUF305 family)